MLESVIYYETAPKPHYSNYNEVAMAPKTFWEEEGCLPDYNGAFDGTEDGSYWDEIIDAIDSEIFFEETCDSTYNMLTDDIPQLHAVLQRVGTKYGITFVPYSFGF